MGQKNRADPSVNLTALLLCGKATRRPFQEPARPIVMQTCRLQDEKSQAAHQKAKGPFEIHPREVADDPLADKSGQFGSKTLEEIMAHSESTLPASGCDHISCCQPAHCDGPRQHTPIYRLRVAVWWTNTYTVLERRRGHTLIHTLKSSQSNRCGWNTPEHSI